MARENETGRVRAAFLTAGNIALLIAPLVIGFVLDGGNAYGNIFLIASLTLAPFITLLLFEPVPHTPAPKHEKLLDTLKFVYNDRDLRAVALGNFVLQFFYHLAPLYIPLYLHTELGIPWSELGWMFSVMLLPFVLVEYPAGIVADKWLGDKGLLIAGFLIAGLSFALIACITSSTSVAIVLMILVVSRIGAALIEAMVESHFFRRITADDAPTLSLFRMTRPVAALTAPIIASIVLAVTGSYVAFFIVMGVVVALLGLLSARALKNVR
jgi:MFS family permease